MRIVPFPGRREVPPSDDWHAALDAALNGEGEDAAADSWRELRAGVRALAPTIAPEFERQLGERLVEQAVRRPRHLAPMQRVQAGGTPASIGTARRRGRDRGHAATKQSPGWARRLLATGPRRAAVIATTVAAVVAAVLIAGPLGAGKRPIEEAIPQGSAGSAHLHMSAPAPAIQAAKGTAVQGAEAAAGGALARTAGGGLASTAPAGVEAAVAGGRVQQRAASIDLSAAPSEVQAVADRVTHIAANLGGYVQSSQVNVQAQAHEAATSRAELDLKLPSAKLNSELATLGELAPVRSESQSLQDITNTYNAAQRRLGDAIAARRALLHALAAATTEDQIDSLRARLPQARRAISEAQSALQTVSQRASTSEVQVEVLGDRHATSEGLTLRRGLRDARKVLVTTLAVLLIASAILVPLIFVVLAFTVARRSWRRAQRERALDPR
jgi:hypothetical protein